MLLHLQKGGQQWPGRYRYPDIVISQKKKELAEFKRKVKDLGLKVEKADQDLSVGQTTAEHNFYQEKKYIQDSFEELKQLVEEKEREMMSNLLEKQQHLTKNLRATHTQFQHIQNSINRYVGDIEKHYDQIIEDLSYEQFNDILTQYGHKLLLFEGSL